MTWKPRIHTLVPQLALCAVCVVAGVMLGVRLGPQVDEHGGARSCHDGGPRSSPLSGVTSGIPATAERGEPLLHRDTAPSSTHHTTHHPPPPRRFRDGLSRRALIVIDMSVDQWSSIPTRPRGRNTTLAVIAKLLSNTTTKFDLIVDTRMLLECAPGRGHPLRELQRTKTELEAWLRRQRSESLICTQWQKAWMLKVAANYPDAALIPELKRVQPEGGRVTFVAKQEFSGFVRSTLDSVLRAHGIDEVYITGINTQICIFRTAMDAWERGCK